MDMEEMRKMATELCPSAVNVEVVERVPIFIRTKRLYGFTAWNIHGYWREPNKWFEDLPSARAAALKLSSHWVDRQVFSITFAPSAAAQPTNDVGSNHGDGT